MTIALEALLPILLVTALGWGAARLGIVSAQGWAGIETIAYQVLFPSIVILNLAQADFSALPAATLGVALFSAVATMSVLCLIFRPFVAGFLQLDGPQFTSVLQGATRWNTFIALAMAANLYGAEGVALTAVAIVAM